MKCYAASETRGGSEWTYTLTRNHFHRNEVQTRHGTGTRTRRGTHAHARGLTRTPRPPLDRQLGKRRRWVAPREESCGGSGDRAEGCSLCTHLAFSTGATRTGTWLGFHCLWRSVWRPHGHSTEGPARAPSIPASLRAPRCCFATSPIKVSARLLLTPISRNSETGFPIAL